MYALPAVYYKQYFVGRESWDHAKNCQYLLHGVGGGALLISDPIPFLLQMYCLEGSTLICEYVNKEINQISD